MTKAEKIKKLASDYLAILEIEETEALENAEYIFKNLIIKDETNTSFIGESIQPVVKVVEYIENPKKTQEFVDYYNQFGKEPEWKDDADFGLKGVMVPYLSKQEFSYTDPTVYYAMVEYSGYNSIDNGKPAIMISKITHLEDLASSDK